MLCYKPWKGLCENSKLSPNIFYLFSDIPSVQITNADTHEESNEMRIVYSQIFISVFTLILYFLYCYNKDHFDS